SVSLVDASRIAQAGATVVVMPDPSKAFAVDGVGEVTMTPRPARFLTIEAAPFAVVEDGADVGESALPLSRAAIDFSTAPQMAIRFRVSRRDQKDFQDQADAIMTAITLGLARAADATLLAAITAAIPAAFSLAAAAEKGLRFDELRALVGTAGAGAAVSQDGKLRVAGVAAELTADTAATFVGAFSRSAVAVHEAIDVVAERTSVAGDLVVTCWANMQALLPNAGMFFKVSA
ncbi:hypothetical protein QCE63_35145, partial [Caballeronia sp. LZ065]|uniref:hypothetical protein n=1 Tax=Caballeronia sp. LZ065 TaxID=3038571 RepID=UPI00285A2867